MTDIPTVKPVELDKTARDVLKATAAVHEGIATHAEKHRAELHSLHARREAQLKLETKPTAVK